MPRKLEMTCFVAGIIVAVFTITSASGKDLTYQAYSDPATDHDQIAVIKWGGDLSLVSVDGRSVLHNWDGSTRKDCKSKQQCYKDHNHQKRCSDLWYCHDEVRAVELLPGSHTIVFLSKPGAASGLLSGPGCFLDRCTIDKDVSVEAKRTYEATIRVDTRNPSVVGSEGHRSVVSQAQVGVTIADVTPHN